ncbi:hypothetical protein [Prochlorococcus sp. MIT 1223]|uniref:hypothetical protein n=1 Tax=Prochlorococcus sp. MIT 1223 TaxID=3096217 RepID=UPI002A756703|nr:hypothetical protein [Prochlorococcus sp. MIT 1223]
MSESEPKWDYTTRGGNIFIGGAVVALNLMVVLAVILDRTVPSVHAFITGKPI